MPRYFFHYRKDGRLTDDPDGEEWPNLAAAKAEAVVVLREFQADALRADLPAGHGHFEITDAAGRMLATITIQDVLGD